MRYHPILLEITAVYTTWVKVEYTHLETSVSPCFLFFMHGTVGFLVEVLAAVWWGIYGERSVNVVVLGIERCMLKMYVMHSDQLRQLYLWSFGTPWQFHPRVKNHHWILRYLGSHQANRLFIQISKESAVSTSNMAYYLLFPVSD